MKQLSEEQKLVYNHFIDTTENIFVSAGPGTGKTHTLTALAEASDLSVSKAFTSFSRAIVEDLQRANPTFAKDIKTSHSMALSTLRKLFPNTMFNVDENKYFNYLKYDFDMSFIKKESKKKMTAKELLSKQYSFMYKVTLLFNLCQQNLVDFNDIAAITLLAVDYDISFGEHEIEAIRFLSGRIYPPSRKSNITYTDMLYYANKFVKPEQYDKFDLLFVDEVQDLNPLQLSVLSNYMNGRYVAVGDDRQTLYRFMGSNLNSYRTLQGNAKHFTLSVTRRCSKAVVTEANKVFPGLVAYESNVEGKVDHDGYVTNAEAGDFVLCRNNKPLMVAAIAFMKLNKPIIIVGKSYGKDLINIVNKAAELGSTDKYLKALVTNMEANGIDSPENTKRYKEEEERCAIVDDLLHEYKDHYKVIALLDIVFQDKVSDDVIILSTIHRSKGLEKKNVYLLNEELLVPREDASEEDKYVEKCLKFVAITRAKENLIYCRV
jgi:superfamily I DNA/RNA helicase